MGGRLRDDRGSAVVEFVLVAPLLVALALGVLQVALALHVRATLTSAAAEGARAAALAGADPSAGARRARYLLSQNIATSVVTSITSRRTSIDGLAVIAVRIDATIPVIGLLGPSGMTVVGHALVEQA